MPLSPSDRIQISGEQLTLPLKIETAQDTQDQLDDVKADLTSQDNSLKIFFNKYNTSADSYQTERRWIDGTTYTTVIESDIVSGAKKEPGNKFFNTDGSWLNFQPESHQSTIGEPTSSSPDYELDIFTRGIEFYGLSALLDFLLNGQTSVVLDDTLAAPYSPGSGTMTVTTGGQTIGNLIILEGGGFSGLFLVTNVTTVTTLDVIEIVPPDGILPMTTTTVIEDITAFTNSERNTLTSVDYQNVIEGLADNIKASVLLWETAATNQLTQLNLNTDNRSPQAAQIAAAISDVTNAKSIIDFWQALPDTGTILTDSKFVDVNIITLQNEITARITFLGTRTTQVTTALGGISQNPDGTYTGTGIYYLRFAQIDSRINLAGGPLTEFYEKDLAITALEQIVTNALLRADTFNSELRTEAFSENANGTSTIKVASVIGFSNGNTVYVMADTLTELTGTIVSISAPNIVLSFNVPNTYTKENRARIYKQL